MKRRINSRGIGNILLIALFILLMIHLFVLFNIFPSTLIWDTTIHDAASVIISEWIAIFFILFFSFGICLKLNYLPFRAMQKNANAILWIMVLYYALNVIGSFLSNSSVQKLVYAPLTLIMIFLLIRLIFSKVPKQNPKKRSQNRARGR